LSKNKKSASSYGSRAYTKARNAADRLDEVVYRISHDLQGPARAIRIIPEWLNEDFAEAGIALPDPIDNHLELLRRQAHRMQKMIMDLLIFSRIGRHQPLVEGNLEEFVTELFKGIPGSDTFSLSVDFQAGFPEIGAEDAEAFFSALLSNSVKHHPKDAGSIDVRTSFNGRAFSIQVADDGAGIPEKDREHSMGFMTTLQSRDETEGSGMGLPIAIKVCETYGGSLEIDACDDGRGCVVRGTFPIGSRRLADG
jgi:signal transduction histidine kinase